MTKGAINLLKKKKKMKKLWNNIKKDSSMYKLKIILN